MSFDGVRVACLMTDRAEAHGPPVPSVVENGTVDEHRVKVRVMMLWDHARCRPRTHDTVRRCVARCSCGWRSRPLPSEEAAFRAADVHEGVGVPYRRLTRP